MLMMMRKEAHMPLLLCSILFALLLVWVYRYFVDLRGLICEKDELQLPLVDPGSFLREHLAFPGLTNSP